jgi:serine/threonine protein kinase
LAEESQSNHRESWIKLIESQQVICDRYHDIQRIDSNAGDGQFSLVFKARDRYQKKRKEVVLKFFNPLLYGQRYRYESFYRESDILKDLRGQRNILPLIQEKTEITLSLNGIPFSLIFYSSHLAKFSIKHYIYNEEPDPLTNILYFREICKAVQRIHHRNICHRDLKPGNFLVFGKRNVCLSDFGTARYFGEKVSPMLDYYPSPVGDRRYTGPELLCLLCFSDHHNYYADIYSLGAILFELFTKTVFSSNIFRENEIIDLAAHFHSIPERERKSVFDQFIDGFAEDRELPSVRLYDESIPKPIAQEVDRLYKSLASLNYKKREMNFQRIFLRINICEKVIRYLKQYERWEKKKFRNKKGILC